MDKLVDSGTNVKVDSKYYSNFIDYDVTNRS